LGVLTKGGNLKLRREDYIIFNTLLVTRGERKKKIKGRGEGRSFSLLFVNGCLNCGGRV